MLRPAFILIAAFCLTSSAQSPDALVDNEMARLRTCPAVFKTSPPPVYVRVVWRAPEELTETDQGSGLVRIEFLVRYEQSDFLDSAEAAEHATDFHPMMELRQRNYYAREAGTLHLRYREALIGKKWEKQNGGVPELSCWQTLAPAASFTAQ
jgi:hypothetical protein